MTKKGFIRIDKGEERRIYYIEKRGKDSSFQRWRATLYYAPNFAVTAFFDSESEYSRYCSIWEKFCFSDFEQFKKEWAEEEEENEEKAKKIRDAAPELLATCRGLLIHIALNASDRISAKDPEVVAAQVAMAKAEGRA
jgi:hypothetical protein